MRVKFYDGADLGDVKIQFNGNIVTIETDHTPDDSGFNTYAETGVLIHKYPEYNTVYRELDNGFQLSNDGSKYVPPAPPEPPKPTYSTIKVGEVEYKVVDLQSFGDVTFLMEDMTVGEATLIFENVTSIEINGVVYDGLVFQNAYKVEKYDTEYVEVYMHKKTEMEYLRDDINANTESINKTNLSIGDNYDADKTYSIDEYCMYQGNLYRFTRSTGKGIAPTNTLYWTLCNIATELNILTTLIKEK